ncbi:MAG: hypothetical protein H6718_03365 [Polyangiaceae bacterium]|nr:hypothetical protein [Polyangiaceae bacterium]
MADTQDTEPNVEGEESAETTDRQTLPPGFVSVAAPGAAGALVGEWLNETRASIVPRRAGARAEQAWLRGRLAQAKRAKDLEQERVASVQLARALAARGSELDTATRLARRALVLGEDPQLREELSGWFAGLGEPALAAATLRPAALERSPEQAALILTRIAVLEARAGSPESAVDVLSDAGQKAPNDALIVELLGAIGAWAPAAITPARAADAYVEGARRREARGERAAAFEDLLRAFELCPESAIAAELLAQSLSARGRGGAADEVLREHALASQRGSLSTHLGRLRDALGADDLPRALAAGLDAGLDQELDPDASFRAVTHADGASKGFDEVLARAGLHELLAARLQLGLEQQSGAARARLGLALGRLYSGPLNSPERAVDAWMAALVADPSNEDAKIALRSHASATRDQAPLVEALIRVGRLVTPGSNEAVLAGSEGCLTELMVMAEQRLSDPTLAAWALERLATLAPDAELDKQRERLRPRARLQQEATQNARAALAETSEGRGQALRRLVAALRFQPEAVDEQITLLNELAESEPEERAWRAQLERLLERERRAEELTALLESQLKSGSKAEAERAALRLSQLRRTAGDTVAAVRHLEPLLDAGAGHRAAWCMLLLLANRIGSQSLRARALERLAQPLARGFRAVIMCAAADAWGVAGRGDAAWAAAHAAKDADPSSARAAATLASCALEQAGPEAAGAIEHAVGVVVPRARWCRALAQALDEAGELPAALAWTQRWLALRPGDPEAAAALLDRVTRAGNAERLADALGWLLSQAQPAGNLAEPLARALLRLSELEPARAGAVARRVLDLFGPRAEVLCAAILEVADSTGERGLGIAVRERQLASGAPGTARPELLLEVARRRTEAGDADGAARCLARAIHEGASADVVLQRLDSALPPRGSDGEIALLEARAECLSAQSGAGVPRAARAWRELGAALWDLAADHEGAIAAWERAALLDPESGIATFAQDLLGFAGQAECVSRVRAFAERRTEPAERARALTIAANEALKAGDAEQALELALASIELDPSRSEVLAVAERAAGTEQASIEALERAYYRVAQAALGCYGERAVHYRAARHLERRGELKRALSHAVQAFEAVPAQGITFVQMVRLAERAAEPLTALTALERVAAKSSSDAERAEWLERAAVFSGSGEQGQRQRLEVLLRALTVRPEVETLRSLGETLKGILGYAPQERDVLELRLERALSGLLSQLEQDDGARLAVQAARAALEGLGASGLGWKALRAAYRVNPAAPELEDLADSSAELAEESATCDEWLDEMLSTLQLGVAGVSALALSAKLAEQRGRPEVAAKFLVEACLRESDRADLQRRVGQILPELPEAERTPLERRLLEARSPEERVTGLLEVAQGQLSRGDQRQAAETLEQARAVRGVAATLSRTVLERLREAYSELGQSEPLVAVLREQLALEGLGLEERIRLTRDVAALLATRGDAKAALKLLKECIQAAPDALELVQDLLEVARQAGDDALQISALRQLSEQDEQLTVKLGAMRDLAGMLQRQGDLAGARALWEKVLELDATDAEALSAAQRAAEAEGDWEAVSGFLKRRASRSSTSGARALRLERVRILEQHLGRADEARGELESMLNTHGEDLDVLCSLARTHEQLGDQLRAAPLWLQASAIAGEKARAAALGRAACRAYLAGGDVDSARRVLDGMEAWAQSEEMRRLRVEVERVADNPLSLAEALEELALSSMAPPAERASLLVESASATERGSDVKLALARAQRAARIAPQAAEPQLFARYLEYRTRHAGGREDARVTLTELRSIEESLDPEQTELRAFLLAEALDVLGDGEAAMRELQRAHAEVGALPLIAIGLGERLLARGEQERALPFFDAALDGDLRAVRKSGQVALDAAQAALDAKDVEHAARFLEQAAIHPESRATALLKQVDLRRLMASDPPPPPPEHDYAPLPREEPGADVQREERVGQLVAPSAEPPGSERPAIAPPPSIEPRSDEEALSLTSRKHKGAISEEASVSVSDPRAEAPGSSHRRSVRGSSAPPRANAEDELAGAAAAKTSAVPSSEAPRTEAPGSDTPDSDAPKSAPASVAPGSTVPSSIPPGGRLLRAATSDAPMPLSQEWRRASRTVSAHGEQEAELLAELSAGSVEAGRELIRQLQNRSDRSQDLVAVCRRVSTLVPGDRWTLERLYEAALADKDFVYARAVEHVLYAFGGGESVSPPELETQLEQPERVHRMLFGEGTGPGAEALALVWEGAQHIFRRDPSSYGVTGVERVPLNAPTPLARGYTVAARLLGLARTPLFQRKSSGAVTLGVALMDPPGIILSGDVPQMSPELSFHLGAMLGATLPQYVLLFGSTESQARAVFKGLGLAFGPPRAGGARIAAAATLAEVLWESIPARSQRRLRELCDLPEALDYDLTVAAARLAIRRAGLFVGGDLAVAVRETCTEEGIASKGLESPGGLATLCAASPAISDLVLIATSPEFADARWRSASSSRKRPNWSTF